MPMIGNWRFGKAQLLIASAKVLTQVLKMAVVPQCPESTCLNDMVSPGTQ